MTGFQIIQNRVAAKAFRRRIAISTFVLLGIVNGFSPALVWTKTAGVLMVLLGAGLELAAVWLWSRDQLGRIRTNKSR
jgi:protein-S-isoprenylcysteine O-methyltransferase Ste14